jgi:predicted nucleic acid-binding protein
MSVKFLDTNIVIYALDGAAMEKQIIAQELLKDALVNRTALISFQVVQETLNTISRKFKDRVSPQDSQTLLESMLLPLMRVMPSANLYKEALNISIQTQFSFYDSLIVAAALSASCDFLLTEDLQHGQVVRGLEIVNPFLDRI